MSEAGFEFLDEIAIADIAFRAWGPSLAEVFRNAATAVTNVMVDELETVVPRERRVVELYSPTAEMLLFDLLQELIFYKDAEGLLLLPEQMEIEEKENGWSLWGALRGEKLEPERHPLNADVKAVTMHRFALRPTEEGWQAEVVLDI